MRITNLKLNTQPRTMMIFRENEMATNKDNLVLTFSYVKNVDFLAADTTLQIFEYEWFYQILK